MQEKSYRYRMWPIFIFLLAFLLCLMNLLLEPSLSFSLKYQLILIFFPVLMILQSVLCIFFRIEIYTTKLIFRIGNIKFYYHEIPWDEVTWLEDDYFWPLYIIHVYGFKDSEIRKKFIDEYRNLELKEGKSVKDREDLKDYIKRAKKLGSIRRRFSKGISFINLAVKGYKDFNREVIFRSLPDTIVPYSLLKRVGLTQSDIGKLYKGK